VTYGPFPPFLTEVLAAHLACYTRMPDDFASLADLNEMVVAYGSPCGVTATPS
jgi:hypothetical protein